MSNASTLLASMKYSSKDSAGMVPFGTWLRQLREQRAVPLRTVAAAAEMDQAHLSKVELGQRLPTAAQTSEIARFFGIDVIQMDARRIAEKFRMEHGSTPAASQALLILNDAPLPPERRTRKRKLTAKR